MSRTDWSVTARATALLASPRLRARFGFALFVLATAYAVAPLRQQLRYWNDFAFAYTAGLAWLHGASPYDVLRWHQEWVAIKPAFSAVVPSQPFLYPPSFALIAVPVALLPWLVAARLWDVVNVLAFAGLCVFSVRMLPAAPGEAGEARELRQGSRQVPWLFLALAALLGALRWALSESQLVGVPALAIVAAFWAWHARRPGLLAVFAFVAALKPHVALLPLAYLFLNGGAVAIALAAAAAVLVGVLAMLPSGLSALPGHVADAYAKHMAIGFNGLDQFTSASALFATHDPQRVLFTLCPLLGLCVVAWLSVLRRSGPRSADDPLFQPLWQLSVVVAASAAFVPLHAYDLITYIPLVILASTIRPRLLAAAVVVSAHLACRGAALGTRLQLQVVTPYLTLAVLTLTVLALQHARPPRAAPAWGGAPTNSLRRGGAAKAGVPPREQAPLWRLSRRARPGDRRRSPRGVCASAGP